MPIRSARKKVLLDLEKATDPDIQRMMNYQVKVNKNLNIHYSVDMNR